MEIDIETRDNLRCDMVNLFYPRQKTLPTMYDLPSEEVGEPGLPDQFHPVQAELLRLTFVPRTYQRDRVFSAMDLNVYYDENNTRRYKRPDWFGVVGVPRLYEDRELRLSYVIWQEGVTPFIVVELLSPSTQAQDLGQTESDEDGNPTKWEVYEQILKVPYYVVYNRQDKNFRVFHLEGDRYRELALPENRLWLEELGLGLGLWRGNYEGVDRPWLRFYDADLEWIPTPEEEAARAQQEKERALQEKERALQEKEAERQRVERLEALLRANNINIDEP